HRDDIAADAKEQAVSERQYAEVTPDQVEREREHGKRRELADGVRKIRRTESRLKSPAEGQPPTPPPARSETGGPTRRNSFSASLEREQSLRPPLQKADDHQEHDYLGRNSAPDRLDQHVDLPDSERCDHGAGNRTDASHHDHHEAIDDEVLAHLWIDAVDRRERQAGETRQARSQSEGQHVDPSHRNSDATGHG